MERREAIKNTVVILGYTITASAISNIITGCNSNNASADGWKPAAFSQKQLNFVSEFAETILPKTNTPGAKDVQVERFIDVFAIEILTDNDRKNFINNIDKLSEECKEKAGKNFLDCTKEERNKCLAGFEKDPIKSVMAVWGIPLGTPPALPFYRDLKGMILWAYFTSKEVGQNVLRYDPVPGVFKGDIPLSEAPKISFE